MSEVVANPVEVRRVRQVEGRSLRSLRLEALQDSPLSYGSTHEVEVLRTDEEWRERAAAGAAGDEEVAFAAVAGKEWVAMARGYLEPPVAHLIAVYVTPDWRHRGIGHAVSQAVVGWARERRASAVLLSVSDWNEGADGSTSHLASCRPVCSARCPGIRRSASPKCAWSSTS